MNKLPTVCLVILILFLAATRCEAQSRSLQSSVVCQMGGESNQGGSAFRKTDICQVPNVAELDATFRQGDFNCCGGGASSPMTNANVPAGLELRVTGGHFWSVTGIQLAGDRLSVELYCGPAGGNGPGCNVKVTVVAHYRVPTITQPVQSPPILATTPDVEVVKSLGKNTKNEDQYSDRNLAFAFGVFFIIVMLFIAGSHRKQDPPPFALWVYRVVLALAAGGIGAVVPGWIYIEVSMYVRAGGAIALFVIVYMINPPGLVTDPRDT